MAGLTDTGFVPKRAADVYEDLKAEWVAQLSAAGQPTDIDFDRDTIAGLFSAALSIEVGAVWDVLQAVYDAGDPNNATGVLLDNIGSIRGSVPLYPIISKAAAARVSRIGAFP